MKQVWIWQRHMSPHTAGLATALAEIVPSVHYLVEQGKHEERAALGWTEPELGRAELRQCSSVDAMRRAAAEAPPDCEHIFQGIRANGLMSAAQDVLRRRGIPYWAFFETVDDRDWRGVVKRSMYRWILSRKRREIRGLLAIGHTTPDWLAARGLPRDKIRRFSYFVPDYRPACRAEPAEDRRFQILFVGKLIPRKGVDLLLQAVAGLAADTPPVTLSIVGNGPSETELRNLSGNLGIDDSVCFLGNRPIDEIPGIMEQVDLFVLPSRFDGWGAVVSEALIAGTPVVASDRCGAAEAVLASGIGGVFPADDVAALCAILERSIAKGPAPQAARRAIADWARSLGATAGASYFLELCEAARSGTVPAAAPWLRSRPDIVCNKIENMYDGLEQL